ncbi:MAG: di-trans,poly-cis-decaprenylcistransferase [Spirochaetales bacterium]|nr:di-trans,poly-cis-decaprenylcistransferase [Spirochaetales bacterium]
MDGNGRWAQSRNAPRTAGHREGLNAAKAVVRAASEIGLKFLTLYVFSTENWRRAEEEVRFLMRLIAQFLKKEYDFYRENRIRVTHSGDIARLPRFVQKEIRDAVRDTAEYGGTVINLAINYGGRDEIVRAAKRWLESGGGELDQDSMRNYLDHPEIPDPDLIIRTGGERRLSNFLIWESAYSEYYFTEKLWPDFGAEDLIDAIKDYGHRKRKYGGTD